jgi:hypothetical protein
MNLATIHTSVLDLLQSPACALLAENNVACLSENKGDIADAIDQAIAKSGICAIVVTPLFRADSEASRSIVGTADIVIQVFETPTLNRTQANHITALDAAEYIACNLNLACTSGGVLVFRRITTATVNATTILYNVEFSLKCTLSIQEATL